MIYRGNEFKERRKKNPNNARNKMYFCDGY